MLKSGQKSRSKSRTRTRKNNKHNNSSIVLNFIKHKPSTQMIDITCTLYTIASKDFKSINLQILDKINQNIDSVVDKCKSEFNIKQYSDFDIASISLIFGFLYKNNTLLQFVLHILNQTSELKYDINDLDFIIQTILYDILIEMNLYSPPEMINDKRGGGKKLDYAFAIFTIIGLFLLNFRMKNMLDRFFNNYRESNVGKLISEGGSDYLHFLDVHCKYEKSSVNDEFIDILSSKVLSKNTYKYLIKIANCAMNPKVNLKYIEKLALENTENAFNMLESEYYKLYCDNNPDECLLDREFNSNIPKFEESRSQKSIKTSSVAIYKNTNLSPEKINEIKGLVLYNANKSPKPHVNELVLFESKIFKPSKLLKSIDDIDHFLTEIIDIDPNTFFKNTNSEYIDKPSIEKTQSIYSTLTSKISELAMDKSLSYLSNYITGKDALSPITSSFNQMVILMKKLKMDLEKIKNEATFEVELTVMQVNEIIIQFSALWYEIKWFIMMNVILLGYLLNLYIKYSKKTSKSSTPPKSSTGLLASSELHELPELPTSSKSIKNTTRKSSLRIKNQQLQIEDQR